METIPENSITTSRDSRNSSSSLAGNEEETINSMEEYSVTSRNQQSSSSQERTGHTLPILQKIIGLSVELQNLKKDHANLSHQVKIFAQNIFPDPDVLDSFRLLSKDHELLKKRFLKELCERKRLYNEVIELKGNIRVFCRCRPLNKDEIANGSNSVVEFDPLQDNELQIVSTDSSKKQFKFDNVFKPNENQEAVFAQTKPIVASVLDGFNVCIFAYGQTGTGKTFTMEGTPENRGVNYRTLEELFAISQERNGVMKYELFVSMLEVYNEKIRDLLADNSTQPKRLEIKQTVEGTQEVPGLVEARVYGTKEVWELLKSGSQVRSVGSTTANELSSRSHCLLRVTVKGENLIDGQKTKSHLWLVDLAGSERLGKIEVEGERLKESQFINKSLSALGDVISALASKSRHVPYRNSKLTHLLQSSVGGDCKTLMFVQISPCAADLGETICSLNFASRVRGIESGPARKQTDLSEIFKYKQMAEKLKHDEKETKKLSDSLQSVQLRLVSGEHICRSLQEKVRDLENQLAEERRVRIKQETRAFAVSSSQSALQSLSFKQVVKKPKIEKKPPLRPLDLRMPLQRITNFLPPTSLTTNESAPSLSSIHGKENVLRTNFGRTDTESLMIPRRCSIAYKPPPTTHETIQPKRRRVSIAALRPDAATTSSMITPLNSSRFQTFQPKRRVSIVTPRPDVATASSMMTPLNSLLGFKLFSQREFSASSATVARAWKPTHPTVVALQRRSLVWSPLRLRSMKSNRRTSPIPS